MSRKRTTYSVEFKAKRVIEVLESQRHEKYANEKKVSKIWQ